MEMSARGDAARQVVDRPDLGRFELTMDGHTAELVYRIVGGHLVLVHTEVPEALEGRGIGGALVEAARRPVRPGRSHRRAPMSLRPSVAGTSPGPGRPGAD